MLYIIKLKHQRRTMQDFNADQERFEWIVQHNGKLITGTAIVTGRVTIDFHSNETNFDNPLDAEITENLTRKIFEKIDANADNWSYPKQAYDIADAYCAENFN